MGIDCNAENIHKQQKRLKCILIGDEGVGKSAIVRSFKTDEFSPIYTPTIWNNFSVRKQGAAGEKICLDICDTGGQSDFDRLRPLCYAGVDVFIICFNVASPASFQNIITKWLPEIKRHSGPSSGPPGSSERIILLVGTKSDLRSNTNVLLKLSKEGMSPVSECQAMKLAKKIGAKSYIECSSLVAKNVKDVFDYTLTWGLNNFQTNPSSAPFDNTDAGGGKSTNLLPGSELATNSDLGFDFRRRGTSRHLFRWKSYKYNQKRKQHSPSTKLKRFILMCCVF